MLQTRLIMGMPVTIEVVDPNVKEEVFEEVFSYFDYVDKKFSTYKDDSEISRINRKELEEVDFSQDMKEVLQLSEDTKKITNGYFDIKSRDGKYDPSGLVKGWAIYQAAEILIKHGFKDFYVEAGGDIQAHGKNSHGESWRVGIRNPLNEEEIIKVVGLSGNGMATSGTYIRGQHIYNPHDKESKILDIVSLTVVGLNIYEVDRFATAAFAMGQDGINFIESFPGLEGYMIDKNGVATMTTGFKKNVLE